MVPGFETQVANRAVFQNGFMRHPAAPDDALSGESPPALTMEGPVQVQSELHQQPAEEDSTPPGQQHRGQTPARIRRQQQNDDEQNTVAGEFAVPELSCSPGELLHMQELFSGKEIQLGNCRGEGVIRAFLLDNAPEYQLGCGQRAVW